jgi:UDP-GlcNAc:undecaprenyl-phosphate/decaprenyl-phosphate GlcNAc-1-phosphate transferase
MIFVVSFISSLLLSAALTVLVRRLTRESAHLSTPGHVHSRPLPRFGGVAVFLTFGLCVLAFVFWKKHISVGMSDFYLEVVVGISSLFFLTGLLDDLRGLRPSIKLVVQIAGANALYFCGIHFTFSQILGGLPEKAFSYLVTLVWVVLICNAINMMDGLDGLAAGAALFSMVTIFVIALPTDRALGLSTVILGGSVLGFLAFNMFPASVLLGESGSLFIGFILSGFSIIETRQIPDPLGGLLVAFVAFALPLTDVVLSVLRRFLSGADLFGADREHIQHKLLELGLTQRQVVFVLYGASAICALLSISLLFSTTSGLVALAGTMLLVAFFSLRKLFGFRLSMEPTSAPLSRSLGRLRESRDFNAIISALRRTLRRDFEGFELALDSRYSVPGSEDSIFGEYWGAYHSTYVTLSFDLATLMSGSLGHLILYRATAHESHLSSMWTGNFRKSLSHALERVLKHKEIPIGERVFSDLSSTEKKLFAAELIADLENFNSEPKYGSRAILICCVLLVGSLIIGSAQMPETLRNFLLLSIAFSLIGIIFLQEMSRKISRQAHNLQIHLFELAEAGDVENVAGTTQTSIWSKRESAPKPIRPVVRPSKME